MCDAGEWGSAKYMKKELEIVDPQQIAFLGAYLNPKSKTFGDMKNSAVVAGYTESYADNLSSLMPKWLSGSIGQDSLLKKAERNLEQFLDMPMEEDRKVKADITKFVAARASNGKWSEKQTIETTNKNLNVNIDINQDQVDSIVKEAEEKMLKLLSE